MSPLDVLNNALGRVLDRLADASINGIVDQLFGKSGSNGLLSGLFGGAKGFDLGSLFGVSPLPKFAAGGILSGPGTGTSDSMLARVSKGEAIVPARVVAQHRPLVQALVDDRVPSLPRFAEGGMVNLPELRGLGSPSVPAQVGRAGPVEVNHSPTYYATPAKGVTAQELAAVIDANNQAFAASLPSRIRDIQRRTG